MLIDFLSKGCLLLLIGLNRRETGEEEPDPDRLTERLGRRRKAGESDFASFGSSSACVPERSFVSGLASDANDLVGVLR